MTFSKLDLRQAVSGFTKTLCACVCVCLCLCFLCFPSQHGHRCDIAPPTHHSIAPVCMSHNLPDWVKQDEKNAFAEGDTEVTAASKQSQVGQLGWARTRERARERVCSPTPVPPKTQCHSQQTRAIEGFEPLCSQQPTHSAAAVVSLQFPDKGRARFQRFTQVANCNLCAILPVKMGGKKQTKEKQPFGCYQQKTKNVHILLGLTIKNAKLLSSRWKRSC